jgi:hypothetical protein
MSREYLWELIILPMLKGAVAMAIIIALSLMYGGD